MSRVLAFCAMILAFCATLGGCSPRVYERIVYQRDTTYLAALRVDSVFVHDSVYVREKADTVFHYVERVKEKYQLIHDTVLRVRVDSVAYETIKEVKVDQPLSWWQKAKIGAFPWLLLALGAALLYIFRKPILAIIKILLKI